MYQKCLGLLLLMLTLGQARGQNGCTDSRATNFDPAAVTNDGSCQYTLTTTTLLVQARLPAEVAESSGLQFTAGQLWTHNDSNNEPVLYRLSPDNGSIQQRVQLTNFANTDWEDLAADAQNLYIGDFGNNDGNRRDLRILKVRQADLGPTATTAPAEAIQFRYPDQTNFNPGTNNHNFDCEAFFYFNDSLHLFTKNWGDFKTKYYTLPAMPGTYVAKLRATLDVNGLITAADINAAGTEAALLGYNHLNGSTFVWLLFDFPNARFLQGNKRRLELPNALFIGQAEGLTFASRYQLWLSNEQISTVITVPPRLYGLNASPWLAPATPTATRAAPAAGYSAYPDADGQTLWVQAENRPGGDATISLQDLQGRQVSTAAWPAGRLRQAVPLRDPDSGIYILRVEAKSGVFTRKVVVP